MPIHSLGNFESGPKKKKTDAYEEPEESEAKIDGYHVPLKKAVFYGGYEIPEGMDEEGSEEQVQEDEAG